MTQDLEVGAKRMFRLSAPVLMGDSEVVLEIRSDRVGDLALELSMLTLGVSKTLRLLGDGGPAVVLQLLSDQTRKTAVVNTDGQQGEATVELAKNQAEYILATLLRTVRDGCAPTEHIHVDGHQGDQGSNPFALTFFFDVFRQPMSAEQARQRILEDL